MLTGTIGTAHGHDALRDAGARPSALNVRVWARGTVATLWGGRDYTSVTGEETEAPES